MPPIRHAYLSASSAHRWMNCPASPYFESCFNEPDESVFATEGTLAHALAEQRLTEEILQRPAHVEEAKQNIVEFYANHASETSETLEDVMHNVDAYINFIREQINWSQPFTLMLEQQLNLSKYIPQGFGTSDVVLIQGNSIHIIDFKYGSGVLVEVQNNPQLMIYALGAYDNLARYTLDKITTVRMSIFQPRKEHWGTTEMSVQDLLSWAETTLVPAARNALNNREDYQSGDWCRFCRGAGYCRHSGTALIHSMQYLEEHTLSPEETAYILDHASDYKSTLEKIQSSALTRLEEGHPIPGYKAVLKPGRNKLDDTKKTELLAIGKQYDLPVLRESVNTMTALKRDCKNKGLDFYKIFSPCLTKTKAKPAIVKSEETQYPDIIPLTQQMSMLATLTSDSEDSSAD